MRVPRKLDMSVYGMPSGRSNIHVAVRPRARTCAWRLVPVISTCVDAFLQKSKRKTRMCGRMECGSSSGQGMHASILGATQNQWIAETEGGDGYGGGLVAARAVSTRGVVVAVDQPEPVVRDVATACKCDVLCSLFFPGRCLILLLNSVYRNCLRSSAKQDLIRTLDRLIKSRNEEHGTTSSKVRFFIYKERKKLRLHPPSAFSA